MRAAQDWTIISVLQCTYGTVYTAAKCTSYQVGNSHKTTRNFRRAYSVNSSKAGKRECYAIQWVNVSEISC